MSEKPGELSVNLNVNVPAVQQTSGKTPYTTGMGFGLWCTGLLGACGIHRFYLGKPFTGLLWLVTLGLLGVGQVLDLFRMKTLVRNANFRDGRVPPPFHAGRMLPPQQVTVQPQATTAKPKRKPSRPPSLRQQLLKAAVDNGGELTVTQGVLATDKSFEEIERALNQMSDKGYVDVDNAPGTGVIVYRFPELVKGS